MSTDKAKHRKKISTLVEERRQKVAQLYIEGKSMHKIAAMVGVSQTQIFKDLKKIRQQWLESSVRNFDEAKEVELRKLQNLEKEAYDAWERSKEEAVTRKKKSEKGRTLVPQLGNRPPRARMVVTRQNDETTEMDRDGDPRFLAMIFQCIQLRLKVLGALEQDKTVNVNVSKMDWDQMFKRQEDLLRIDPISQRLLQEQGANPVVIEQKSSLTGIQLPPDQLPTIIQELPNTPSMEIPLDGQPLVRDADES